MMETPQTSRHGTRSETITPTTELRERLFLWRVGKCLKSQTQRKCQQNVSHRKFLSPREQQRAADYMALGKLVGIAIMVV